MEEIMKIVQSNEEFILSGELDIQLAVVRCVSGSGRYKKYIYPREKELIRIHKKSIITIRNKGKLTLF